MEKPAVFLVVPYDERDACMPPSFTVNRETEDVMNAISLIGFTIILLLCSFCFFAGPCCSF